MLPWPDEAGICVLWLHFVSSLWTVDSELWSRLCRDSVQGMVACWPDFGRVPVCGGIVTARRALSVFRHNCIPENEPDPRESRQRIPSRKFRVLDLSFLFSVVISVSP